MPSGAKVSSLALAVKLDRSSEAAELFVEPSKPDAFFDPVRDPELDGTPVTFLSPAELVSPSEVLVLVVVDEP